MAKSESTTSSATGATGEQTIEELQRRYQGLHTKKIQAETQRAAAKQRLDELKSQARDKYGTDDLGQLRTKLDEMIAENARKRAAYQAELDKIESGLADVERQFAEAAPATSGQPRR